MQQLLLEHLTLGLIRLDGGQYLLDGVDRGEQEAGQRRIQVPRSITQLVQDVLCDVRDGFQALVAEESAGALYGVDDAKNAG